MLKFTHTFTYLALSGAYVGACLGVDDTAVKVFAALLYLLLALDALKSRR